MSHGYFDFAVNAYGGYVFTITAAPELISSITDPAAVTPEPSGLILVAIGAALIGIKFKLRSI